MRIPDSHRPVRLTVVIFQINREGFVMRERRL